MPSTCEICSLALPPGANFCSRCGLRQKPTGAADDPFRESLVAKAGAALLHRSSFLPSLVRFLFCVLLSVLVMLSAVRLIIAWGGGQGGMGILMLTAWAMIATAMPVEDGDRPGKRTLVWLGRVIWGLILLLALMAATEHTPLRPR